MSIQELTKEELKEVSGGLSLDLTLGASLDTCGCSDSGGLLDLGGVTGLVGSLVGTVTGLVGGLLGGLLG